MNPLRSIGLAMAAAAGLLGGQRPLLRELREEGPTLIGPTPPPGRPAPRPKPEAPPAGPISRQQRRAAERRAEKRRT